MPIDRRKIRWNGWGWNARHDAPAPREETWAWLASELGMPALLATPARPLEEIKLPPTRLAAADRNSLTRILGPDQVRDDAYERAFHALGRSYHDLIRLRGGDIARAPDAVVYPRATTEVLSVLAFASERDIAVTPFGGGTSVVGGVNADSGHHRAAITLDLSDTHALIGSDERALTATAEAGIYGPELEKQLQAKGLTLGHYPQSFEFSTLGGWIAHRGSGQASGGYGRVEDWLVGVVLATPRGLLETKSFPASSSGPDLKELVIGSEGSFGVITQATFRVRALPSRSDYRAYLFRSFESGAEAIRKAMQDGLPATMLRLSDASETGFYQTYASAGHDAHLKQRLQALYLDVKGFDARAAVLIAGFEGDGADVPKTRARFDAIARKAGALALGESHGKRWREGRFEAPYLRDAMMERGVGVDTLETATSWTNIMRLHGAVAAALSGAVQGTVPREGSKGIVMCHISHAYADGASLYFTYIFPRALDDEIAQWRAVKSAATNAVIANGGTLSHHHGVGEDHLPWIEQEKGALGMDVLRAIKSALDPKGILNPGKLIPPDQSNVTAMQRFTVRQ